MKFKSSVLQLLELQWGLRSVIAFVPSDTRLSFLSRRSIVQADSPASSVPVDPVERTSRLPPLRAFRVVILGDEEDENSEEGEEEDDEPEEDDPYKKFAASEFDSDDGQDPSTSALAMKDDLSTTMVDWGGALGKLRQRVEDVESGLSKDPSHALFRMLSSKTPNQLIGQFVVSADPNVVQAMSGAVQSLLGGLSNPNMGIESVVKASGEKIGSLCFQLQMTG